MEYELWLVSEGRPDVLQTLENGYLTGEEQYWYTAAGDSITMELAVSKVWHSNGMVTELIIPQEVIDPLGGWDPGSSGGGEPPEDPVLETTPPFGAWGDPSCNATLVTYFAAAGNWAWSVFGIRRLRIRNIKTAFTALLAAGTAMVGECWPEEAT